MNSLRRGRLPGRVPLRLAVLAAVLAAAVPVAAFADDDLVPPASVQPEPAAAEHAAATGNAVDEFSQTVEGALSPQGLNSTLKMVLVVTVVGLVPSVLAMTTCFVRFLIVFGLLRQALGAQQLVSNQVLAGLCLFLTASVMAPVWQVAYEQGIRPYTDPVSEANRPDLVETFEATVKPLRQFMSRQIDAGGNQEAVFLLLDYQRPPDGSDEAAAWTEPTTYEDVPLSVLLPAFVLGELKIGFLIGFLVYLPFVVIDMVVSSILVSLGMLMLPPVLVSLPLKLLLFVLIDGWFLTVGMLLDSVAPMMG